MIKINLLDASTAKGRTRRLRVAGGARAAASGGKSSGLLIVAGVAALMLVINGGAGYLAWDKVHSASKTFGEAKTKCDAVEAQIRNKENQAEEIRQFSEVVNNQMDVLRSLDPPDRILWAEKINMLAALAPKEVFLDEIEVVEQVDVIETEQSRQARDKWKGQDKEKRGPEPLPVKRPVVHYQVLLTGVALGDTPLAQFDNVQRFQKALAEYSVKDADGNERKFMDGFLPDISFGTIQTRVYPNDDELKDFPELQADSWMFMGLPVNKFTFSLNTRSWGMDDDEQKSAATQTAQQAPAEPKKLAAAK